jgi:uncharacterized protein (TIGR03435 family)
MTNLQRRIYGAVLWLHPTAFRNEFGREMELDFDAAVPERGFTPLLGDAIFSVTRQWWARILLAQEAEQRIPGHPFLAGQYFMVGHGSSLTAFDLARASVLSALLLLTIGFAASIPNKRAVANLETVRVSHDGGIDGCEANRSHTAAKEGQREVPGGATLLTATGNGTAPYHGIVRLGRGAAGPEWGPRSSGGPPPRGSLADALRQLAMISVIVWITSFLLRQSPGIGRRVILTALGLVGITASAAFGSVSIPPTHAQILHPTTSLPSFEVATVKLIKDGKYGFHQGSQDEVYIIGRSARYLIGDAYNLPPGSKDRLIGGPAWLDTNDYQIDGKIEAPLAAAMQKMPKDERIRQMHLLMQSLLADRFKLKVHFETRTLPVYALVVEKSGSKLAPSKDLPPLDPSQPVRPRNPADLRGSLLIIPKSGLMFEMIVQGETLDQIANMLTPHPEIGGRPVINRTGLPGIYDFTMDWAREQEAGSANDTSGPGLFAALEQQLGLKLVSTKAQVEVVVIDHIELPSEN